MFKHKNYTLLYIGTWTTS